jgi:hypothetical protein
MVDVEDRAAIETESDGGGDDVREQQEMAVVGRADERPGPVRKDTLVYRERLRLGEIVECRNVFLDYPLVL